MITNVDLIKNFYTFFKNQDKQRYLQLCDDDIEWTVMENIPNGGTHVGKKAIFEEYFPNLFSNFAEFHAITEEFMDAGNVVIALGKYHVIAKKSMKKFESPFAHVYTIKNGKIVKFRQYTDTMKIQEAARN